MTINRPIRTDEERAEALREIEGLMDARADTPEGDRLDLLVTLVNCTRLGAGVAEILNRTRPLTLPMIRGLSRLLNLPADVLVQPYPTEETSVSGHRLPSS